MKKDRPYSPACTQLADKKMISSLVSSFSAAQGGHIGGEVPVSSPVPACHGNMP
jgi:hypothetical protein